jgi:hypothetical protein
MRFATLASAAIFIAVWPISPTIGKSQSTRPQEFTGRLEFNGEFNLFIHPAEATVKRSA